jgi:hypothetical protein
MIAPRVTLIVKVLVMAIAKVSVKYRATGSIHGKIDPVRGA